MIIPTASGPGLWPIFICPAGRIFFESQLDVLTGRRTVPPPTFMEERSQRPLKIHSVKLYEGNREVAADTHEGWTGVENKDNSDLKKYRTNLDSYTLKAEVSGVSEGDSKGEMTLKKEAR